MERIRKDFNTLTLVMIPVAIAINIAIGQLVVLLKLPFYLDSIGTILVGVVAGPWAGALTGFLSNMIWGLSGLNPTYAPFALVALMIGLVAGLFSELGWMRVWWRAALAGLITGILSAFASAPIANYVFGGVTGTATDVVVAFFQGIGYDPLKSNFMQGLVSDPLDKLVSFVVVYLIILALPKRFLARFSRAENIVGSIVPALSMMTGSSAVTPASMSAAAAPASSEGMARTAAVPMEPAPEPVAAKATSTRKTAAKKPAAKAAAAKTTSAKTTATKPGAAKTTAARPAAAKTTPTKPATARKPAGGKTPTKPAARRKPATPKSEK